MSDDNSDLPNPKARLSIVEGGEVQIDAVMPCMYIMSHIADAEGNVPHCEEDALFVVDYGDRGTLCCGEHLSDMVPEKGIVGVARIQIETEVLDGDDEGAERVSG